MMKKYEDMGLKGHTGHERGKALEGSYKERTWIVRRWERQGDAKSQNNFVQKCHGGI